MKSDEVLLLFAIVFLVIPVAIWAYQDSIFAIIQVADSVMLKGLSYLPFVGDHYGRIDEAYNSLEPAQLTWKHIWIAGQAAWRPLAIVVFLPMMLRWAWKARKKRSAQAFKNIDKAYILKHCATKQTTSAQGARQQWVVRRWYQHYGLHKLTWGSADWHVRLRKALVMQLGAPVENEKSQALLSEFATFINAQVQIAFGSEQANQLTADMMVREATRSHAYVATAMVRILAAARDQFGVISPQGFRNRLFQEASTVPIWFALNGLMRQTTHAESLGVLSHFYVEVAENEPLTKPQMENAFSGLEKYREHLLGMRKLKDLDESEAYAAAARSPEEPAEQRSAQERYSEEEQKLA